MRKYPHIIKKVFGEPWAIRREQLMVIQRLVEARVLRGDAGPEVVSIGGERDEPQDEVVIDGKTAIIPIHGIIGQHLSALEIECGGCDLRRVAAMLDEAEKDAGVSRVLLDINSPGGTVTGVPEFAARIARSPKRIEAYTDSECCSAAYWIGSQAAELYATPSSEVGSIGVWMAHFDHSRQLANDGVSVTEISSGKYKTMGAPWRPLTAEEFSILNAQVKKVHEEFKEAVLSRRAIDVEHMEGQVFDGGRAAEIGLVSGLVEGIDDLL